jgi:nucleotide-binding universal stress UspA family protein
MTTVPLRPSATDLPDPATVQPERVLLASEGREISSGAVELAAQLARQGGGAVYVFSIARVWGTSLGLPNPGLLPSKGEWDVQRDVVAAAVKALKGKGVRANGHVLATRKATKRIVAEAERLGCGVIVMGADPPRNRFLGDFMWSQEPYRVRRRADRPVYLVTDGPSSGM